MIGSSPPLTRRRLLVGAAALTATGAVTAAGATRPWETLDGSARSSTVRPGRGKLVLVTLYGGNDGLNTVVPSQDPAYRSGRPHLGYTTEEVLDVGDGLGLNPKLPGLKALWDARQLAIVRGVGYPQPSLSHFQSMDIWQTANLEADGSGWIGRWLDATGDDPMRAISVGAALPLALRGDRTAATAITATSIALPGDAVYRSSYAQMAGAGSGSAPDALAGQVTAAEADLLRAKVDLDALHLTSSGSSGGMGRGGGADLADQLAMVASLIEAGAPTQVYQVSLSSFDTHADEKATQEGLLAELDTGVSTFLQSLGRTDRGADVVVMTYSEFGRRVAENASGGTDHGTASPLFVAGAGVKGGTFHGDQPSLTRLDAGDLDYTVDFRSVYATMLERLIGVDPRPFLGASYPTLDLF